MDEPNTARATAAPVDEVLRDELVRGDIVLGTIGPILGHLLANADHSLFSDEIVARIRGMTTDIARQLLHAQAQAEGREDPVTFAGDGSSELAGALMCDAALLCHCHALAIETQLAARLEQRSAIDPVLTPMLQSLIASDDSATSATAMAALSAQARFIQQQRRMELPLGELPGDLFHQALTCWRQSADGIEDLIASKVEAALRGSFDEGASRLGLFSRLVTGMGKGVRAALSIQHSGIALFFTALALESGQRRDLAVLSSNDSQLARLALGLRAVGLKPHEIEEQFLQIHPEVALPAGFDTLRADSAARLLASSARQGAD